MRNVLEIQEEKDKVWEIIRENQRKAELLEEEFTKALLAPHEGTYDREIKYVEFYSVRNEKKIMLSELDEYIVELECGDPSQMTNREKLKQYLAQIEDSPTEYLDDAAGNCNTEFRFHIIKEENDEEV